MADSTNEVFPMFLARVRCSLRSGKLRILRLNTYGEYILSSEYEVTCQAKDINGVLEPITRGICSDARSRYVFISQSENKSVYLSEPVFNESTKTADLNLRNLYDFNYDQNTVMQHTRYANTIYLMFTSFNVSAVSILAKPALLLPRVVRLLITEESDIKLVDQRYLLIPKDALRITDSRVSASGKIAVLYELSDHQHEMWIMRSDSDSIGLIHRILIDYEDQIESIEYSTDTLRIYTEFGVRYVYDTS